MYKNRTFLLTILLVSALTLTAWSPASAQTEVGTVEDKARVVGVDCDEGESLARALRTNIDLRNFWFTGTCEESEEVLIARNRVRLRGVGDAVLVGGIRVQAALGVELHDFAIRDSPGDGVFVAGNSDVHIENLTLTDTGRDGIGVENSVARLHNVSVTGAGRVGILNFSGRVNLSGTMSSTQSIFGFLATHGAIYVMEQPDFVLDASDNFLGINIQANSSWRITQGTMTINNSVFDGLTVSASTFDHRETDLNIADSGGTGLFVANNSYFAFSGGNNSAIRITGSGFAGILAFNAGNMEMLGHRELTVTDNPGIGVWVDRGTLQVGDSVIRDNAGGDLLLTFTARVTLNENNDIGGPIVCQGPVYIEFGGECEEIIDALNVKSLRDRPRGPRF